MAQRICFLGRGGSGKSTVAQNLGHALALKGYRVLLVGNDISLSSTLLLRGEADISPALEDYREHYEIDLADYVLPTASGVYCLELGSIDPGVGCLARGISLIDEMLDTQGVSNRLQLDFILYDISGETPCTGYILPIREGLMQRCVIVTNGSFASVTTANSLLQAILRASGADSFPVQLIVNNAPLRRDKGGAGQLRAARHDRNPRVFGLLPRVGIQFARGQNGIRHRAAQRLRRAPARHRG